MSTEGRLIVQCNGCARSFRPPDVKPGDIVPCPSCFEMNEVPPPVTEPEERTATKTEV